MMLFDKARENAEAIRATGVEAIKRAKAAGMPAYYNDPARGGLVKEMPDNSIVPVSARDIEGAAYLLDDRR